MLWSFIKIALFLIVVAAATLGLAHLADMSGGLRLTTMGMEFTLGPLQAVIAAIVVFLLIWLVIKVVGLVVAFLRFLAGDETAITRYFDRNRERKGYQALSEGMLAAASGEGRLALSKAAKAERYLQRPELTNLLMAQAAEIAGDKKRATEGYKRLLSDNRTRFVGIRGLLRQKLDEGDTETALKLAQKAYALKPRHREMQDTLLSLQTEKGDWKGAREILQAKLRQGELPRDLHKRRDAVLALQEAKGVMEEGASVEAREAAIAAAKSSPDLIPAVVMAARAYIDKGKPRAAERILRKAWEAQPHPDLAAAYAEIKPDETAEARLKRFATLLSARPDHEETRLLKAELNIAAEDFPAARRALGDLVETHPTARVLTIMAAVERGEGADDVVVRGWLARALTAPRGPQWCCDKCQNIQADWSPVCDNCGGFDTLSWREPQKGAAPLPHGAEMLPLIVGKPSEPVVEAEIPEAEIVDGVEEGQQEAETATK
ncbi:MAG: heme biosynthesis protein HemY [Rhodobacteraceae bacterium]|uniref:Heme biosynthesis protein HemY n=1 Tax=Thioclava marina TaxID=1915077 RepID=A0ABX3MQM3_9RHOB|nr:MULTISPECIES: heme biosynthesis HemY N-terminal domain-containing protein [Thioclava]TNE85854.1 MAG: heme biosynthesis protein HemY [Paracoccaceae bacterium]MBD3801694.1 heme biosynthesis protein HemY [Thioclava sp.]OOY13844.1 heme biosynthesis protein HemY [Thioclava marina]OOY29552.1 heme biosynthesis protein HemY [Thioclava sp. L04-15]TNF11762.1 MAG: heme biosynthesis protein HemY [Paracoccaceae bacterium]